MNPYVKMTKNFFTETKDQYDRSIAVMRAQESKIQTFATASSGIIALVGTIGGIFDEKLSISNEFVELIILSFILLVGSTIMGFYGVIGTKYRVPIKASVLKHVTDTQIEQIITNNEDLTDKEFAKKFSKIYLKCLASLEQIIQKRLRILSIQIVLFTVGNIILGIFLYLVLVPKIQ